MSGYHLLIPQQKYGMLLLVTVLVCVFSSQALGRLIPKEYNYLPPEINPLGCVESKPYSAQELASARIQGLDGASAAILVYDDYYGTTQYYMELRDFKNKSNKYFRIQDLSYDYVNLEAYSFSPDKVVARFENTNNTNMSEWSIIFAEVDNCVYNSSYNRHLMFSNRNDHENIVNILPNNYDFDVIVEYPNQMSMVFRYFNTGLISRKHTVAAIPSSNIKQFELINPLNNSKGYFYTVPGNSYHHETLHVLNADFKEDLKETYIIENRFDQSLSMDGEDYFHCNIKAPKNKVVSCVFFNGSDTVYADFYSGNKINGIATMRLKRGGLMVGYWAQSQQNVDNSDVFAQRIGKTGDVKKTIFLEQDLKGIKKIHLFDFKEQTVILIVMDKNVKVDRIENSVAWEAFGTPKHVPTASVSSTFAPTTLPLTSTTASPTSTTEQPMKVTTSPDIPVAESTPSATVATPEAETNSYTSTEAPVTEEE